jgi:hypothetical protein
MAKISFLSSTLIRALLALAVASVAIGAQAQWQWLDKDGRKVFSDRPPPSDIPDKNVLKRPGKAAAAAPAQPGEATGNAAGAPQGAPGAAKAGEGAGQPAAADAAQKKAPPSELDLKKKQLADAEAAKRKADQEAIAKVKAENCDRARANQRTLDSGVRLSRLNSKGEREVFDDKIRAEEGARVREVISRECS